MAVGFGKGARIYRITHWEDFSRQVAIAYRWKNRIQREGGLEPGRSLAGFDCKRAVVSQRWLSALDACGFRAS